MQPHIIHRLNAINRQFYEITAQDFDETRARPWPGWELLLPHLPTPAAGPLRVLDVGCGNGRFGVFLAEKLAHPVTYTGLDSNAQLLAAAAAWLKATPNINHTLIHRDVVEAPPGLEAGLYDVVAAFGLLHHIPGLAQRQHFVRGLAARLKPGGVLALACWCFFEYERFRGRISPWPDDLAAEVEAHDYLLDWRRGKTALRYCHYVDDAEHAALVAATGLREITTYRADGFSGAVNRYSILGG